MRDTVAEDLDLSEILGCDTEERVDFMAVTALGPERRGDELPDWVKNKQKRLEKIREAKAALEAEAAAQQGPDDDVDGPPPPPAETRQRNFTDPESRIMKGPDGFVQAYNTQVAVDAEHQVIVAQLVTNQPTDVGHLPPLVAQIKTNTGRQAREVSADAGYCSEGNLKELSRRPIQGYVATCRQSTAAMQRRDNDSAAAGTGSRRCE